MKQTIEELLKNSGKHTSVNFKGKDQRRSFDENFGKDKVDVINTALGDTANKSQILTKLSK